MRFKNFLDNALLEGGKALKTVSPLTQTEVKAVSKQVIAHIAKVLDVDPKSLRLVGSAGNKPNQDDLSNDLDVIVREDPTVISGKLKDLSFDGKTHREFKGINVYSFGYGNSGRHHQVDLIPVKNLDFAEWAYQAHPDDLATGLKGAHRNELFFAVAHYLNPEILEKDTDGQPLVKKRHYYDLGRGLFTGTTERKGKKKAKKSWSAGKDKELVSDDPDKVSKLMFGTTAAAASTFDGVLNAIASPKFPHADKRDDIIAKAIDGIKKKNLKVPPSLQKLSPKS